MSSHHGHGRSYKRYREWEDPESHYYEHYERKDEFNTRYQSPIHSEKGYPRRHRTPTRRYGFPQYRDNIHVILDKEEVPYYRPERSISRPFKHYQERYSYRREEYRRHESEYRSLAPVYNVKREEAIYDKISSEEDYQLREMSPRCPSRRSRLHYTDKSVVKEESISHKRNSLKTKCKREKCSLQEQLRSVMEQKKELKATGSHSQSPGTKRFLKNDVKLQRTDTAPREEQKKHKNRWRQKFNYKFYDPELHWCPPCNVFQHTAEDYLTHLHTLGHEEAAAEYAESPWQELAGDEGYPSLPDVPDKRTPIQGLPFFVPAAAWFCKLCGRFVGDLTCASAHMRSIRHSKKYTKFVKQNPHWETNWDSNRQKALARDKHSAVRTDTGDTCRVQI